MWFQHISTAKMGISWTNMLMEKHCGFKHQNRNCRQPTSGILPSNNGTHLVFLVPSIDRISPEKMWISPSKNMESLITSAHLGLWSKTCVSFSIKKKYPKMGGYSYCPWKDEMAKRESWHILTIENGRFTRFNLPGFPRAEDRDFTRQRLGWWKTTSGIGWRDGFCWGEGGFLYANMFGLGYQHIETLRCTFKHIAWMVNKPDVGSEIQSFDDHVEYVVWWPCLVCSVHIMAKFTFFMSDIGYSFVIIQFRCSLTWCTYLCFNIYHSPISVNGGVRGSGRNQPLHIFIYFPNKSYGEPNGELRIEWAKTPHDSSDSWWTVLFWIPW